MPILLVVPTQVSATDPAPDDPFADGDSMADWDDWECIDPETGEYGEPCEDEPSAGGVTGSGGVEGAPEGGGGGASIKLFKRGPMGRADLHIRVTAEVWGLSPQPGGTTPSANVLFYYDPSTQEGYFFRLDIGGGESGFYRIADGSKDGNPIEGATYVDEYAPGWEYDIDLIVVDHDFVAFVNGYFAAKSISLAYEHITDLYSFNPAYSTFWPSNRVGLFNYESVVRFSGYGVDGDTLYESAPSGAPATWKPVPGTGEPINSVDGWLTIQAGVNAVYLPGGTLGMDGFVMDLDFKEDSGPAGWVEIYLQSSDPSGDPPQTGYVLALGSTNEPEGFHFYIDEVDVDHNVIGESDKHDFGEGGYFDESTWYHLRIVDNSITLQAYIDDTLVAVTDRPYGADYHNGGIQVTARNLGQGRFFVANLVLSKFSVSDTFDDDLSLWETAANAAAPADGGVVLGGGQNSQDRMYLKQATFGARSFEARVRFELDNSQGSGLFMPFHKAPLTSSWGSCFQLSLPPEGSGHFVEFQTCGVSPGYGDAVGETSRYGIPQMNWQDLVLRVQDGLGGNVKMSAWINGELVASANEPAGDLGLAGRLGFYNGIQSVVGIADFRLFLDDDGDGLTDAFERGGIAQETGVQAYDLDEFGYQASYSFPLDAAGEYQPLVRASCAKGEEFVVLIEPEGVASGTVEGTFVGHGHFAIYRTLTTIEVDGPGNYLFSVEVESAFSTCDVLLDWVGMVAVDAEGLMPGDVRAGHIQEATDPTTPCEEGCSTSAYRQVLTRFSEWEYPDADFDDLTDSRETHIQLRTDIPFGVVSKAGYADSSDREGWIEYRERRYGYNTYAELGESQDAGHLLFTLADGTPITIRGGLSGEPATPFEQLLVWPDGTVGEGENYARYDRSTDPPGQNDQPALATAGWGEAALQYDSETSNLRWAYIVGVGDDNDPDDNGERWYEASNRQFIDSFRTLGYRDPTAGNEHECGDYSFGSLWYDEGLSAELRPREVVMDHLLVANGAYDEETYLCRDYDDQPGLQSAINDGFRALGEVMDNSDQLTIVMTRFPEWYQECPLADPAIDLGYAPDGEGTSPAVAFSKPINVGTGGLDPDCSAEFLEWYTSPATRFLGGEDDFLGYVERYSFIVMYNLGPSGGAWYDLVDGIPRFALVTASPDGDAPDSLDEYDTETAIDHCTYPGQPLPDEDYDLTVSHQLESTVYLSAGLGGYTPQDNDLAGSNRYANSFHVLNEQTEFYVAWLDDDNSGLVSFREAYNYGSDHISTCDPSQKQNNDQLRVDDDRTASENEAVVESVGHIGYGWYDGRNMATWYP